MTKYDPTKFLKGIAILNNIEKSIEIVSVIYGDMDADTKREKLIAEACSVALEPEAQLSTLGMSVSMNEAHFLDQQCNAASAEANQIFHLVESQEAAAAADFMAAINAGPDNSLPAEMISDINSYMNDMQSGNIAGAVANYIDVLDLMASAGDVFYVNGDTLSVSLNTLGQYVAKLIHQPGDDLSSEEFTYGPQGRLLAETLQDIDGNIIRINNNPETGSYYSVEDAIIAGKLVTDQTIASDPYHDPIIDYALSASISTLSAKYFGEMASLEMADFPIIDGGDPLKKFGPWFMKEFENIQKIIAPHYEPLVINLMGDEIANTVSVNLGPSFDIQNNSYAIQTAWMGPGSGILVNDATDAPITNGSQMFGTSTSLSGGGYAVDGFSALADLDSNNDGVIDQNDAAWSGLRVWVDENIDGITDDGELLTMSDAGISSISLTTTALDETDDSGNYHGLSATYTKTDSTVGEIDDVSFITDPTLSSSTSTVTVSEEIADLPDVQGYGTVMDLQQEMQIQLNDSDAALEGYVTDFVSATDNATRNALVDQIIYQWAGVQGVSSTERGSYFDARQLEALEKFSGFNYTDPYNSTSDPSVQSVASLTSAYNKLHDYVLAQLEYQTNLSGLFGAITSGYDEGAGNYYWDFSGTEAELIDDLSVDRTAALVDLASFNEALHTQNMDQGEGYATFRSDLVAQGDDVAATFLYGDTVVNGTIGDDVITAWVGDQTVIASQGGDDTLIAGGANETFYGSSGSNLFIGGVGDNQVFWGGNNNMTSKGGIPGTSDTFIAGQGTETFLESAYGSVQAYYDAGDGNLTIDNFRDMAGGNTLYLGGGILEVDASLTVSGADLILTDGTSGDQVTIKNRRMTTIEFADGYTIDVKKTGGIHNASASHTLTGGTLDDIYVYASGEGTVTLSDSGGNNTLYLGDDISSGDLIFNSSGNDLIITDGVSGDKIIDKNYRVKTILFADGTTQDISQPSNSYTLAAGLTTGTALADTYSYASGTGAAEISDAGGDNAIVFGAGITAGDLTFTGNGNNLVITDGVSGDGITIDGQINTTAIVQTLVFSDGSSLDLTAGLSLAQASGTSLFYGTGGADTLVGNAGTQTITGNGGNDAFVPGSGNTTIFGGSGDDFISYASGSGDVEINETDGANSIKLGAGIGAGDISFSSSGHDLYITDSVSGDQVTVKDQLDATLPVDILVFDDGSSLNLLGISLSATSGQSLLYGTMDSDTLYANTGNETIIGNGGNDTYVGSTGTETMSDTYGGDNVFVIGAGTTTITTGSGNDSYSYAAGDGAVTITDKGGQNQIILASGITSGDITLTASNHDLLIMDGTAGDTITLKNQLTATEVVQQLIFSDGSTMSLDGAVLTKPTGVNYVYGTPDADTLTGGTGNQTLNGNGGNDVFVIGTGTTTVYGGKGNDTYSYASGDGVLQVRDTAGFNQIVFAGGISTGDVSWSVSGSTLVVTDSVSGDEIYILSQLSTGISINQLVFADGTTESLEGLNLAMPSGANFLNGTAGNDTLTATTGTETIAGNGGSDTFIGGSGAQKFYGASGDDLFIGGSGTESLVGQGGNDTFIAGVGATTAFGSGGNDVYSYVSGDGTFQINNAYGGNDVLKLGTILTAANTSMTESVNGYDLIIHDDMAGYSIDIAGQFYGQDRILDLVYGDGSTLDLLNDGLTITAASGGSYTTGTAGDDTLIGSSGSTQTLVGNGGNDTFIGGDGTEKAYGDTGNDLFIGGTGSQSLVGQGGNDTFISGVGATTAFGSGGDDVYSYVSGDGYFNIQNAYGGNDVLYLDSTLTASNTNFTESANGNDLIMTDGTSGDEIFISGQYYNTTDPIKAIVYGDGTTLDLLNDGLTVTAASGASTTNGTAGDDTLIGSTGSTQVLVGNGGNDTFIGGDGTEKAYGDTGNDLFIGGTGSQSLVGQGGNDTFISGVGATTAFGSGGDDVYSYVSGDGYFNIQNAYGGNDVLYLDSTLTASNTNFTESANGNDLIMTDGTSGDEIFISGQYYNTTDPIKAIVYGDGTTLDLLNDGLTVTAASGASTTNGTAGDDTLIGSTGSTQVLVGNGGNDTFIGGDGTEKAYGDTGNDLFIGGTGSQSLVGQGGNDTFISGVGATTAFGSGGDDVYSYVSGDGYFNIQNAYGGNDVLYLDSTLTASNTNFTESANGNDLIMTDGTSGDEIFISGQYYNTTDPIKAIVYGDGTTLDLLNDGLTVTAASGASTTNGTAGDDTLIGSTGSTQVLVGNGGNDTFIGGDGTEKAYGDTGNDLFIGGTGSQSLVGQGGNDTFISGVGATTAFGSGGDDVYSYVSGDGSFQINNVYGGNDVLRLGALLTAANTSMTESTNGYDLIIHDETTGSTIDISGQYYANNRIVDLVYGDGTTLDLLNDGLTVTAASGGGYTTGTAGDDTLIGSSGSTQILTGNGGNDTFIGGDGTEKAYGDTGNDLFIGGTGTQSLVGQGGDDTFIAGVGVTTAIGDSGDDLYSYTAGDGTFYLVNQSGGTDTVKLDSSLTAANTTFTESSNGYDLILKDTTSGDEIVFEQQFHNSSYQVETLVYGDGSTLDLIHGGLALIAPTGNAGVNGTAAGDTFIGTTGTQTYFGNGGSDTFIGGIGTEVMGGDEGTNGSNVFVAAVGSTTAYGSSLSDTYSYVAGDGYMKIIEKGTGVDTVFLDSSLTAANTAMTETTDGRDLLITDTTSGDKVDIYYQFYSSGYNVESLVYGDSSTLNLLSSGLTITAASGSSTLNGTAASDTLYGNTGTETINSNGGNDTLVAGVGNQKLYGSSSGNDLFIGGSGTETMTGNGGTDTFIAGIGSTSANGGSGLDTYSYTAGDGYFRISETGSATDTLVLDSSLTASNTTMTETTNGRDLIITDSTSGDQIDIYYQFYSSAYNVENLVYGDGSTLHLVTDGLTVYSQAVAGLVNGTVANDTLITVAGSGVRSLEAGNGNDTYSYTAGDGSILIYDTGGTDTLKLNSSMTASNTFIGVSSNGRDLLITDTTSGDQIDLNNQKYNSSNVIETLVYGDGSTLNLASVLTGGATITGTSGNEILVPNTGNTTLNGGGGDDVYNFARGMGHDVIYNGISTDNNANGTLNFGHGISENQLWLDQVDDSGNISATGNNLRITVMGTSSYVTVMGEFNSGTAYRQLDQLTLSDSGLALDSQLSNLVQAMATFEGDYLSAHGSAFDPTATANASITDTTVLSAVSSDWHS